MDARYESIKRDAGERASQKRAIFIERVNFSERSSESAHERTVRMLESYLHARSASES